MTPCPRCGHLEHTERCEVLQSAMVGYRIAPDFEGGYPLALGPQVVYSPCGCRGRNPKGGGAMNVTPELLAELRQKAEAATPGPWATKYNLTRVYRAHGDPRVSQNEIARSLFESKPESIVRARNNATYIAAANPALLLALLDEIERLREACDQWKEAALVAEESA